MVGRDRADAIVIGAGVMGASIAYQLSRHHDADVLVLDERPPVGGMSGRTFGQIRQHYSNKLLVEMAAHGLQVIQDWDDEIGVGDPGYVRLGYLLLVIEEQLDALRRNIDLGRSCGVATSFVGPDEISEIEPLIATEGLAGGAYEPDGGYIDVTRMVLSWLTATQALGADVRSGVRASGIRTDGSRVVGVATPQGEVDAPVVVLATGAWGRDLLDPVGIEVPIERRRLDMALLDLEPGSPQMHACVTDGNSNVVLRPDLGRRVMAVAYPEELPLVDDPLAPAPETDHTAHLERLDRALAERVPGLHVVGPSRQVSGTYDVTPDFHPLLGWSDEISGLYLAMGFSGHGLKLSPAIGEVVAAAVRGTKPPFDVTALRASRFAEGEPMFCAYGPSARA